MTVRRVEVNGVDFAYIEAGSPADPLALCLHGFPDHAPSFQRLLGDLAAAGYHAVAPWMRGYAPTGIPADGRYHSAVLALDAVGLADALAGDRQAVLVGHDWGAIAAYTAAAYRPERFVRLVTMAVPPRMGGGFMTNPEQLKRSWYMFFFQQPIAEMAVTANDFAFIDMLWRDWSPGYAAPAEAMRQLKDTLASPGTLSAVLGYYRAMWGRTTPDPELEEVQAGARNPIQAPTLYLHGIDDGCMGAELVSPEQAKQGFASGLEVEMVPAAGHFLHLERPELVNGRIVEFLTAT